MNKNKLIVGTSGSGKTCYIIDYINTSRCDFVIIFSSTYNIDPTYNKITKRNIRYGVISKEAFNFIYEVQQNIKGHIIVYIDDCTGFMANMQNKNLISDFVSKCRHYNIECIASVQHLKTIPPTFRDCISALLLTSSVSNADLDNAFEYIQLHFKTKKEFKDYYNTSIKAYRIFVFELYITDGMKPRYYFLN